MTQKGQLILRYPGPEDLSFIQRLKAILAPLLKRLAKEGYAIQERAAFDGDYATSPNDVTIWLTLELAERPPGPGRHILWFLHHLKVTAPYVLSGFDAVLTASPAHKDFLTDLMAQRAKQGQAPKIAYAGWPIDWAAFDRDTRQRQPKLTAYLPLRKEWQGIIDSDDHLRWLTTKALVGKGLPPVFSAHKSTMGVVSMSQIRERNCGFVNFDEAMAIGAGGVVVTMPRMHLPRELQDRFLVAQTPKAYASFAATLADRQLDWDHPTAKIARRAYGLNLTTQTILQVLNAQSDAPKAPTPQKAADFEQDNSTLAIMRLDAAIALDGGKGTQHPVINDFTGAASAPQGLSDLQRACAQDLLAAEDCYRGADIAPWHRVAEESCLPEERLKAISRRLNGHNLIPFCARLDAHKTLSHPVTLRGVKAAKTSRLQVGVFLHAFYVDIATPLLRQIALRLPQCHLYISTDCHLKRSQLRAALPPAFRQARQTRIDVVKNVGRDIYPKLVHFAQQNLQHDLVLHLHTKRSPHSRVLADWGQHCQNALLTAPGRVQAIEQHFARNPKLGMLYPDPPKVLHPAMSWTRNRCIADYLGSRLGWTTGLPEDDALEFPAGSMFWARPQSIAPLLGLGLEAQNFPPEEAQEDGTLAHALERMLGVCVQRRGYHLRRLM